MSPEMFKSDWDAVVSSLQSVYQLNKHSTLDRLEVELVDDEKELEKKLEEVKDHRKNVDKSIKHLQPMLENLNKLLAMRQALESSTSAVSSAASSPAAVVLNAVGSPMGTGPGQKSGTLGKRKRGSSTATAGPQALSPAKASTVSDSAKVGKSYYSSPYNPSSPISVGSEVAFRLRASGMGEEWIQCEVMKVLMDQHKFDVRDPEPDENNNPGKTYRATWKEILLIPTISEAKELINYPFGTKVIARYPETTTFYQAEVIGTKRDGKCRLRFDGEEEVGKETEVDRRLVLPYPDPKSHN